MAKITSIARVDKKTKHLAQRLRKGEIAVIDHQDLDSTCARMLVDCKAAAVINASKSISGRYPNTGPSILLSAGIPIIDNVGKEIMDVVSEGDKLLIDGETIYKNGVVVGIGKLLSTEEVNRMMEESRSNLAVELEKFVQNTLRYIEEEKFLILDPVEVPELKTKIAGRHALIVVRGEGYKEDLAIIKSYLQDVKPVLIAVDGGADALLEFGFKPDLIVGDMDSVSDEALKCGAEIVVHAYGNGKAPGLARVKELGLKAAVFPLQGTSEDMAMMLAYEKGADLIVAVGTHSSLIDFLDKGRAGMASTFLTRLKIGSKLVDAKGVSKLYRREPKLKELLALVLSALAVVFVIAFQSPAFRTWVGLIFFKLRKLLGF
ncbi:MAG: putative cytokinetic ring protein SteA [Armatimonadota bacterium]|nr:putative cytokinetic ring protein SteA [Armatimonadota bacterium]